LEAALRVSREIVIRAEKGTAETSKTAEIRATSGIFRYTGLKGRQAFDLHGEGVVVK
jgi:hypothetical protein